MGMSIYNNDEKSNGTASKITKNTLIYLLFISFCLISFALGRISAINGQNQPKTPIKIIDNSNDSR